MPAAIDKKGIAVTGPPLPGESLMKFIGVLPVSPSAPAGFIHLTGVIIRYRFYFCSSWGEGFVSAAMGSLVGAPRRFAIRALRPKTIGRTTNVETSGA